jgi:hypothetical protein
VHLLHAASTIVVGAEAAEIFRALAGGGRERANAFFRSIGLTTVVPQRLASGFAAGRRQRQWENRKEQRPDRKDIKPASLII